LTLTCCLGTHTKRSNDKKKKVIEVVDPNAQAPTMDAQPLTSPPSIKFKIHKHVAAAMHNELGRDINDEHHTDDDQEELMTYVLTEDIFVEILATRLQVKSIVQYDNGTRDIERNL
jgi:hypothetical protein